MKFKITDRDLKFFITTIALGLLFIAFLQAFGMYLGKPDPQREEITAVWHRITHLPPDKVPALLQHADDKPVMLVIYASWCPYCKELMPEIIELMQHHQMDSVTPLFLSVDERADLLAAYLVHNNYQMFFTPYMAESGLHSGLKGKVGHFNGHIPYIGFFDRQGQLITEFPGMVDKHTLLNTIDQLKAPVNGGNPL
jgi:thiol-disulfide isomerase/thioredoxin